MDSGEGEFSAFHARDLPNAANGRFVRRPEPVAHKTVGAGLLAMAMVMAMAMAMVNVLPPSLASQLLQGRG